MEVSSCAVQGKKMYIVVFVATLTSRVKGFHTYKKQVDTETKLHCELEPENSLCKRVVIVTTKEGDTVGHVPDLLAHVLAPEICSGNIVSMSRRHVGDRRWHWNAMQVPNLCR